MLGRRGPGRPQHRRGWPQLRQRPLRRRLRWGRCRLRYSRLSLQTESDIIGPRARFRLIVLLFTIYLHFLGAVIVIRAGDLCVGLET